jgi:CO/xanthine dehydrogenase FAD-binding subunit
VKPPPFDYHRPDSVEETLALLAEHGDEAKVLAGGQSLVPLMNFRLARPAHLVDILRLDELSYVRSAGGRLHIGAATRQATVERSPLVGTGWPLLVQALECVAHPQIRARGTIGGSLAHADPAAELPVVMAALDATLHVRSVRGARAIPWQKFFEAELTTSLAEDELLVEVEIPAPGPTAGSSFREYAPRHGDFGLAGAAALVTLDGAGSCESIALSLLAAGPAPVLSRGATEVVLGHTLTAELAREAAAAALTETEISDAPNVPASYRRRVLSGLAARALTQAAERAHEFTLQGGST